MDLTEIFRDEIQLALWQRPLPDTIRPWLAEHSGALGRGLRQTLSPGARPDLSSFPPGPGRDALAQDLGLLADMLIELMGADQVGLRLEVIHQAMCPRFHVDRVGIRMLCTYQGPGTEWVEDAQVDRRFLGAGHGGRPDTLSGLLRPAHRIQTIPPGTVALLKGSLWQGQTGGGIVHRSPAVPHGPRILAALDAGWR
jgi:hypothetical protein